MTYFEKENEWSRIQELQDERNILVKRQEALAVSPDAAQEALNLHLEQLKRLGCTLEDSVCCILRNIIESGELQKLIDEKNRLITMHQKRVDEYYG